ncbi:MAG: FAD:protein FMN transferase [Desulfobacteraceae bacterium]|nr:FAD:protein FMN transferase [Desulfobacteraceae bacterium]
MKKALNLKILKFTAAAIIAVLLIAAAIFLTRSGVLDNQQPETIDSKSTQGKKQAEVSEVKPDWWESRRSIYFDIPARIKFHLPGANRQEAEKTAKKAWAEFHRIGKIFNPSDPDSELSRLNAADKTKPVKVSNDMLEVLKLCRKLWEVSQGAFDPTMPPVKKLWQEAVKTQQIPSERQIKNALSKTGFRHVTLLEDQSSLVCDSKGIKFDFGGIAKGFAVDRVETLLKDLGVTDGLVQLGGEVSAFGSNHAGESWKIGIQHPTHIQKIWGTISAQGAIGVSTSGNYRQPLIIQGHEFYHIFSPKTGKPVSSRVLGVTTAACREKADCALLDGASTAITVTGREKGPQIAEKLDIQSLILTRSRKGGISEFATPGLADYCSRIGGQGP